MCIRARLPPGSVAVLINRARTFIDFSLTVGVVENRLFSAIDGQRTIGEIVKTTAQEGSGGEP